MTRKGKIYFIRKTNSEIELLNNNINVKALKEYRIKFQNAHIVA